MKSKNSYTRTYCTQCKNFTVHSIKSFLGDLFCRTCDNKFEGYALQEVEPQLIREQRQRYKYQRQKNLGGIYGAFMRGDGIDFMMQMEDREVKECSAGQDDVDAEIRRERQVIEGQKRQHRQLFEDNYRHLNRNDKCACGSGKKYKQCHLNEFKSY